MNVLVEEVNLLVEKYIKKYKSKNKPAPFSSLLPTFINCISASNGTALKT